METESDPARLQFRSGAPAYFAFALVWSAALWWLSAWWSPGRPPESSPLFLAGGAGPLIAAVLLTHLRESRAVQRDFWRRVFDPRLMSSGWLAVALLLHPAIVAVAWAADAAIGGDPVPLRWPSGGAAGLAGLAFFTFWFGPLPEEIGWRGYALDRLQARTTALRASLVLGTVWAAWHLPLFAVPGTFQHDVIGFGSPRFWIFSASMVPLSVLMTWVYDHTARSTLSAALIHYTGNLCGALLPKTDRLAALELVVLTLCAIGVVAVFGGERLVRRPPEREAA